MRVMRFWKLCSSARHIRELHSYGLPKAQPFPLLHFTATCDERAHGTPSCPLVPENQTSACPGLKSQPAEEDGDVLNRLAEHTWPFLPEHKLHFQGQPASNPPLYNQPHTVIKAMGQGELLKYTGWFSVCSRTYRGSAFQWNPVQRL